MAMKAYISLSLVLGVIVGLELLLFRRAPLSANQLRGHSRGLLLGVWAASLLLAAVVFMATGDVPLALEYGTILLTVGLAGWLCERLRIRRSLRRPDRIDA